jgi:hypothetical protein
MVPERDSNAFGSKPALSRGIFLRTGFRAFVADPLVFFLGLVPPFFAVRFGAAFVAGRFTVADFFPAPFFGFADPFLTFLVAIDAV